MLAAQGTEQSEQSDVTQLVQCVLKCRHCTDLWMYLLDSIFRVCSWGFYRGKPRLQTCPVMLSSLLQESGSWPLPGCVQPTINSDCMSLCVCRSLHVCLHGGKVYFMNIHTLSFKCLYDTAHN